MALASAPTSDEQVEVVARALYNVSHADLISWEQAKADDTPWARGAYEHARAVLAVILPREEVERLRGAMKGAARRLDIGVDRPSDIAGDLYAALTQSEATTPASSDVGLSNKGEG